VVKDKTILELGSGTGLAGLLCGMKDAKITYMTDYHPVVIENAQQNIDLNNLQHKVQVRKLDWRESLATPPIIDPELAATNFNLLLAADCIFDFSHSEMVPKVAKVYLSKEKDARFHVVITYRIKFQKEVALFELNMIKEGWKIEKTRLIERDTIDFRYTVYHL
jgi:predicted nicotinamide N-methyase